MRARFGGVRGVVSRVMSRIVVGIQLPEWETLQTSFIHYLLGFRNFYVFESSFSRRPESKRVRAGRAAVF